MRRNSDLVNNIGDIRFQVALLCLLRLLIGIDLAHFRTASRRRSSHILDAA